MNIFSIYEKRAYVDDMFVLFKPDGDKHYPLLLSCELHVLWW